jgi:hypothetical protein
MNNNLLKEKIEQIKKSCPTIEDFIKKGFDKEYSEEIANDFRIELNNEVSHENGELFELFNINVNFKNFCVFGFKFIQYEEYQEFFHIGFLEADYIIFIKSTKEIAVLDYMSSEINFFLAKKFDVFLDLLPILIDYDKIGYLGENYTNQIKEETIIEIKVLLEDRKYYSFFEQRLGFN